MTRPGRGPLAGGDPGKDGRSGSGQAKAGSSKAAPASAKGASGASGAGDSGAARGQDAWVAEILGYFDERYPDPRCGLDFKAPFELLVATILSAQCTDKRVNQVTPGLFKAFPDAKSMAEAPEGAIEELVKTCGLFRAKANNIRKMSRTLADERGGRVPGDLESLTALPGVGRKTANVVLGDAFGVPGLTVDTHLGRVSRRLGLSARADPERVERDLMALIPKRLWTRFSHQGISHGRELCRARKPLCRECGLADCPGREGD